MQYTGNTAAGPKDVVDVLGTSTTGFSSGTTYNETTSANGFDQFTVTDSTVTINNVGSTPVPGLGVLHSLTLTPSSVGTLYVRTGNEASPKGDTVTVLEEITLKNSKADEPSAWAKIVMPSKAHAWVNTSFLDTNKTVIPKKLNLRAGAGENYSVIGTLVKLTT